MGVAALEVIVSSGEGVTACSGKAESELGLVASAVEGVDKLLGEREGSEGNCGTNAPAARLRAFAAVPELLLLLCCEELCWQKKWSVLHPGASVLSVAGSLSACMVLKWYRREQMLLFKTADWMLSRDEKRDTKSMSFSKDNLQHSKIKVKPVDNLSCHSSVSASIALRFNHLLHGITHETFVDRQQASLPTPGV